jgi:hypothetical protein
VEHLVQALLTKGGQNESNPSPYPLDGNALIVFALVALFGAVVGGIEPAGRPCTTAAASQNGSLNGLFWLTATTTQSGCSDIYLRVESDIPGINASSAQCQPFFQAAWSNGWCTRNTGPSSSAAGNSVSTPGCGPALGISNHYYFYNSPILIATGKGAAYKLTSVADGVRFDIDGDGVTQQMAWTSAKEEIAFLAMDRNGNGVIDNGKELFGDNTLPGSPNGFDALEKTALALNGNQFVAFIDEDQPVFTKLLLWADRNHNGVSEPPELEAAREVVSTIGLSYFQHNRRDGHGNQFAFRGWVWIRTAPGKNFRKDKADEKERQRPIYDVFFKVQR